MIKVRSKTDVITNSSTEVFIFKMDQDYYDMLRWIKEQGREVSFWEVNTLEDLKEVVTSRDYDGWRWNDDTASGNIDQIPIPDEDVWAEKGNFLYDYPGKTIDEIWELTKHLYKDIPGHAFYCHDTEFGSSMIDSWIEKRHKEIMKKLIADLPNDGGLVSVFFNKTTYPDLSRMYEGSRFVVMLSKDRKKISMYHPSYEVEFSLEDALTGPLTIMDKSDIKPATFNEIRAFEKALKDSTVWELDEENYIIKKKDESKK